ncbi:MAG: hypothetical protein NTV81_00470 [Candidatus Komeilibacteria bacterium]|nr:hypothetical protein [Candidatus Komeilibacteria bacterium]
MIKLTIEDDEEILKRYGLVTALYSSIDYLLEEFIRLEGGLHKANKEIVNLLLDKKTLGTKIDLANKLIIDAELKNKMELGLKDRNILTHGVSVDQGGNKFLMTKGGYHPLTTSELDKMIARARELGEGIIKEIQKRHQLTTLSN